MPLRRGSSDQVISDNIRTLRHEGYKQRQAIAVAYRKAGRSRYNPMGLSGTDIMLFAGGALAVGIVGYLLYKQTPAATAATTAPLPVT